MTQAELERLKERYSWVDMPHGWRQWQPLIDSVPALIAEIERLTKENGELRHLIAELLSTKEVK